MAPMTGNGHCHSFNGDGKLDIATRSTTTGELFVFPHSGQYRGADTYLAPVKIGENFHPVDDYLIVRTIDIDGNGRADILALSEKGYNPTKGVFLCYNKSGLAGMDTLAPPMSISSARGDMHWETVGVADLTGNGIDDMFGRRRDEGNVDGFLNRGAVEESNTYDREPLPLAMLDPADFPLAMADFTGRGRDDLLVLRANGELQIHEYTDEYGGPGNWFTIGRDFGDMVSIAVTDVDLDGKPDLLCLREDGTVLAYRHRGKFDPDRPLDLFDKPETVFTGWTDFDIIT